MCRIVPSEKPLEEQTMEESSPKVCLPWGPPEWKDMGQGRGILVELQKKTRMSWPTPTLKWCPEPMVAWCHLAPGASCRGNSCQPHSNVAQPSNSSSAELVQHIYPLEAVCCAWVQEHGLWATSLALCGTNLHVTRLMHRLQVQWSSGLFPEGKQILEVYRQVYTALHLNSNDPLTLDLSLYSWHRCLQPGWTSK